ncbi:hypothetical protein OH77DRAFT_3588 [Trametes cingulata]|nr:hypothetical protein OH77DRAFT_3588 [Trametes cingulata]
MDLRRSLSRPRDLGTSKGGKLRDMERRHPATQGTARMAAQILGGAHVREALVEMEIWPRRERVGTDRRDTSPLSDVRKSPNGLLPSEDDGAWRREAEDLLCAQRRAGLPFRIRRVGRGSVGARAPPPTPGWRSRATRPAPWTVCRVARTWRGERWVRWHWHARRGLGAEDASGGGGGTGACLIRRTF